MLRLDGVKVPVLKSVRCVQINGRDKLIETFVDITAQKLAEEKIRGYMLSLESTNEALKEATQIAESATRSKSQFLASMSHEIRTPLNGVIGMTELLANTTLDDRQRRFVEACHSSGKSLLALINDILDLSKIEAGKLELDEDEFDLGRLVEETVETMAFQARQKGIQLFSRIAAPSGCRVLGDSGRLRQLLVNLVGNAVKFTEAGEVSVVVEPVKESTGQAAFRFSVSDTGIGIPPDRLNRLFVSFSQADCSTTRKYGGTGLGLAISKNLVELMSGRIGVESVAGRSSTFWFILPLPSVAADQGNRTAASAELQRLRILVFDRHAATREHLIAISRSWGIPVDSATSQAEAIAKLRDAADAASSGRSGRSWTRRPWTRNNWATLSRRSRESPCCGLVRSFSFAAPKIPCRRNNAPARESPVA